MGSVNDVVDYVIEDGVAVITIDNPPVNAIGAGVRAGLLAAIEKFAADETAETALIHCAGRTFCAGADIREFGKPRQPPFLGDVINLIEAAPKPVVAAIHGTAFGGGLEIALGCHRRIGAPAARFGLPEVKLGLLPGAGGTQRLPRLAGPLKALDMIVSGNPVGAAEALAIGLIDAIAGGGLRAAGLAEAKRLAGSSPRRTRDITGTLDAVRQDRSGFDKAAQAYLAKARGEDAPRACVTSVTNALDMAIDEALIAERQFLTGLAAGDQSRARRHLFFAEREAAKIDGLAAGTGPRPVDSAAIIGAGTMGGGIAMCFANAGIPVTLIEMSDEALQRGLGAIARNYGISAARGGMTQDEAARRMSLITGVTSLSGAAAAGMVIEAVFEDMAVKQELFARLDAIAKPGAVLATNTSYLDVNVIASATSRPGDVVGMHFFSPANVMKLLEVVRAEKTSPDALLTALDVGKRIGKISAVVGVCDGFVGNRMLQRRTQQAERLLLEGALPHQIDKAMTDFGFAMGPLAVSDLAGLDIGWRRRQSLGTRAEIADSLVEAGRLGQKTAKG